MERVAETTFDVSGRVGADAVRTSPGLRSHPGDINETRVGKMTDAEGRNYTRSPYLRTTKCCAN